MTTTIGPTTLPLPSGEADDAIVDLVCKGLADYLAFWIRTCIGAKAVEQRPTLITDALPVNNVFYVDPRGTWARDDAKLPSLYVYWEDKGESKWQRYSTSKSMRERTLKFQYAMGEVVYPDGARVYSGLASAVDAAIAMGIRDGYHPSYGYGSDPDGTPIATSLGGIGIDYLGGGPFFAKTRPASDPRPGGQSENTIHRGIQLVIGKIRVQEILDRWTATPQTALDGADAGISHDSVLIVERDNL